MIKAVLTAPRRLYELWRWIFPERTRDYASQSHPSWRSKRAIGQPVRPGKLEKPRLLTIAFQAREEARKAYLDAVSRRDTRTIHETHERFVAATAECLRLSL